MKRVLYLLLGVLCTLIGLELVLQALPVSTATNSGYYIHPGILTYPPHHQWTTATGWDLRDVQQMRANNYGFAAMRDFRRNEDAIGLVGDSYVESSMLPPADRPAAQLERFLGGARPVYAMGGPGSALLDYGQRIRWAYETLGLRDFVVIMEPTDASQTLCNSGNIHSRCLDPELLTPKEQRRPASSGIKDIFRQSAIAQYLVSQLKLKLATLGSADFWKAGAPDEAAPRSLQGDALESGSSIDLSSRQMAVIDAAIEVFSGDIGDLKGLRLIFAVDMNRDGLYSAVPFVDEGRYLSRQLRLAGYKVVQGEPLYRAHVSRSPLRLEVGPHDGHLNSIGVGLLMSGVAQSIQMDRIFNITEREK